MSTCPCLSTCAGGPEACAQETSTKPRGVPALFQPSLLHQCLRRGPPPSPNATQRTRLLRAIPSTLHRFLWRTRAACPCPFSCLPLLPPHPCQHTYRLLRPANTYTPTTFTISTPTLTRSPNLSPCCSIPQAPPSPRSAQLLSRSIS